MASKNIPCSAIPVWQLMCVIVLLILVIVPTMTPSYAQTPILSVPNKFFQNDENIVIHYTEIIKTGEPFNSLTITMDYAPSSNESILGVSNGAVRSAAHADDFLWNDETVTFNLNDKTFQGSIPFTFSVSGPSFTDSLTNGIISIDRVSFIDLDELFRNCFIFATINTMDNRLLGDIGQQNPELDCFENHTFSYSYALIDINRAVLQSGPEMLVQTISSKPTFDFDTLEPVTLYGLVIYLSGNYSAQNDGNYVRTTAYTIFDVRTAGSDSFVEICSLDKTASIDYGSMYQGEISSEERINLINDGTEPMRIRVSASDWVSENGNMIMNTEQTAWHNFANVDFESKRQLSSNESQITSFPFQDAQMYIQTKVDLLDEDFRGPITQDINLRIICF